MSENRVYLDSCCFIDLITFQKGGDRSFSHDEKNWRERQVWFCKNLISASADANEKKFQLFTAGLTVTECTSIKPLDEFGKKLNLRGKDIKKLFDSIFYSGNSGINIIDQGYFITQLSAELDYMELGRIKPTDRIHLATAIHLNCKEFITLDEKDFHKKKDRIESKFDIQIIFPNDTRLLPEKYRSKALFDN